MVAVQVNVKGGGGALWPALTYSLELLVSRLWGRGRGRLGPTQLNEVTGRRGAGIWD